MMDPRPRIVTEPGDSSNFRNHRMTTMTLNDIRALIRDVPDFPKPGIIYKDITPLLADPNGLAATADYMVAAVAELEVDGILAVESRGFIFGAVLAQKLGCQCTLSESEASYPVKPLAFDSNWNTGSITWKSIRTLSSRVAAI